VKLDPLSQFYKDMLDKLERKPMFQKQPHPFAMALMENGDRVTPLVTLCDDYGISHIINDDGCYVLINSVSQLFGPHAPVSYYKKSTHWFPEAVKALGEYLAPKPIYFKDGFCDAAEYAYPDAMIQMAPETDASVARAALRAIAKDSTLPPAERGQAAATLLAYSDE
jgi:hypothetical protein